MCAHVIQQQSIFSSLLMLQALQEYGKRLIVYVQFHACAMKPQVYS